MIVKKFPKDIEQHRYAIRPLLLFKKFGTQNVFFVEAAKNYLSQFENLSNQAVRDCLVKSESYNLISVTRYHHLWVISYKKNLDMIKNLNLVGPDKNRNLYYFSHDNVINLEKIFKESLLNDDDYPNIAKSLLLKEHEKSSSTVDDAIVVFNKKLIRK